MLGGLFLMLSYFGCDQSQVQRYLTAKSVDDGRTSLLMSAYWKIPLQVLVLHGRRVHVPVLSVQSAAAAVQSGSRRARSQQRRRARLRRARARIPVDLRGAAAGRVDIAAARHSGDVREQARATDEFTQQDAALRSIRSRAIGARAEGHGRRGI